MLEETFGKVDLDPKVQRIYNNPKSVGFTKNWYSRPTPPDLQFEERILQTQFSVSSDKIYEWNIDGLSEQELLNKMNHMSMVANAYDTNQNLSQAEIVDLLATGFSGTLRSWWDKHLTEDTREGIRKAVKKGDDGFPIFNERVGMGEPDAVNTLIYTIIKHFIGTPSNITARISDVLNNLRCPTMSDYRWYQDVFHSRVMLKSDSDKPYWKEKFIDGLPSLFAHKVKDELLNPTTGMIDYEILTYGEIFSTVKKLGIRMCIDQKLLRQQMKNSKKMKYEMGNFCEQFGLVPIAPSKAKRKKSKKFSRREPAPHYNTYKKRNFNKPSTSKNFPKKFNRGKKKKESKFEKYLSKGKCFNCGETGHYADKCPKPPKKIKQEINALNISEDEKHNIFQILQNNTFSDYTSEEDILTSDDSDYHSASSYSSDENIKFGCFDSCCNKKVFVLTKTEEHEDMLLKLISQIENPELKEEYLKKLKKLMTKKEKQPSTSKISLEQTLERFSKPKTKVVTISDLQHEISNIKNDIVELKKEINILKTSNKALEQEIVLTKLNSSFPEYKSENEDSKSVKSESSEHTNEEQSNNMFPNDFQVVSLLNKVFPPKWYTKVHIIVAKDYSFDAIALVDTGADLNCIQEGLVPSRYFEKSIETLSSASGNRMQINFELNNAHVCQDRICFQTPSVLIKNMSEQVILGMPFVAMIYPFKADLHGIKTNVMGVPINFQFASKFEVDICHRSMNYISAKTKHLNFLKQDVMYKKIFEQLSDKLLQSKIVAFHEKIVDSVCSDLPNAFWHRKKHIVSLPYVKDFSEKKIPTKARPIQMNAELLDFCQKEISDLLAKGIIRKSKSPWSCAAFYVKKNAEIERGVPRLVINYKPLNDVLEWIRYPIPNRKDLVSRLSDALVFSKFDMKSGFWQIQICNEDRYKTAFTTPFGHYEWNVMPFGLKNAPSEFQNIMNNIFNPFSHFTIVYIDDVLIFSKSIEEHWKHLNAFLETIKHNGLVVSASKIKLFQTKIRFLGFDISEGKIRPIDRAIQFADKFPDVITEKTQLQRFLGSLNYIADFYKDLRKYCKPLFDRLKGNPSPWTNAHTVIIKQIKIHVKTLPCLGIPSDHAFKIVETDASEIGFGGILKQRVSPGSPEQLVRFHSGSWNTAQSNYSTIKKEILSIVLCITKFQSDLLNQRFLLRIDCKSAKYILKKDVENIASKQIFARWQAILSVFDFDIEYIKGSENSIPDFLTREFLQPHDGP
jgi:hypothetical protein